MLHSNLEQLIEELENRFCCLSPSFLSSHPPQIVARSLIEMKHGSSYHALPDIVQQTERSLLEHWGEDACEAYNRLVTVHIIKFNSAAFDKRFPASIGRIYKRENHRILSWVKDRDKKGFRLCNDSFVKDLKCLTMEMIPCGARVVEIASSIPRAVLYSGGFKQFCKVSMLLASVGGHKPFFQNHVHSPTLFEFNQEGLRECYLRIVDLFDTFPKVKGLIGGSWYYDPAVEKISPRLAYVRKLPLEGGAEIFRIGPSEEARLDALLRSATRRSLYSEGKYIPTSYLLIWTRDQMIEWSRNTGYQSS
jgi:hypothetical protein